MPIVNAAFPQGASIFFQQTTAPVGWTKQTTNDDYTLRVVASTNGGIFNGSVNFTTALIDYNCTLSAVANGSTNSTVADLPDHNHTAVMNGWLAPTYARNVSNAPLGGGFPTSRTFKPDFFGNPSDGNQGCHSHTMGPSPVPVTPITLPMAIKYVDFILATKN